MLYFIRKDATFNDTGSSSQKSASVQPNQIRKIKEQFGNEAIESKTVQSTKLGCFSVSRKFRNGRPVSLADGTQRERRDGLGDIEGETWIGAEMGKFARRVVAGSGEIVECKSGIKFSNTSVTFESSPIFSVRLRFCAGQGSEFRALPLVEREARSRGTRRRFAEFAGTSATANFSLSRASRRISADILRRFTEKYIHTYTLGANRYTRWPSARSLARRRQLWKQKLGQKNGRKRCW